MFSKFFGKKKQESSQRKEIESEKKIDYQKFYKAMFKKIESEFGALDEETLTSIVGFSAGGPVSMSQIKSKNLYVTCELSVYDNQNKSSQNLNYEFFSVNSFNSDWCHTVFTALGNLSMESELGTGHIINLTGLVEPNDPVQQVKLKLFSRTTYKGEKYGVYEVIPA